MKKAIIFDGHNTFIRNFVVNPTMDQNGVPIGGLVGTLRSVRQMIQDTNADRVFFVWDGPGGSRKRRGVFAEYKQGRKPRLNREFDADSPVTSAENMLKQMERLKQLLGFLGITQLEVEDIEADDAIAYLVGCLEPTPTVVVSSDKDMWQLISPTTVVYWPTKKVFLTTEDMNRDHVLPQNWIWVKALTGDPSDNIKGVGGFGEVTVKKMFPELNERVLTEAEFFSLCETKVDKNPRYQTLLDKRELVTANAKLMQLSSPIISAHAAGIIRSAVSSERQHFDFTSFKLALLNQGIQITDSELFTTFQAYRVRAQNAPR
jgi:5'-3' exonuclease